MPLSEIPRLFAVRSAVQRRRAVLSIAAGTALLAFSGCATSTANNETRTTALATEETVAVAREPVVGFVLPDTAEPIWTKAAGHLQAACDARSIGCDIRSAEGDRRKMAEVASSLIANGIKVLGLTNLDSVSALAIQQEAIAAGVRLIDFRNLTLNGRADVFVGFDSIEVGRVGVEGVVTCLGGRDVARGKHVVQIGGSPTDLTAKLIAQGQSEALSDAGLIVVSSEAVPDADPVRAAQLFEQQLSATTARIDAVVTASDTLALAVQDVLIKRGLSLPVTGAGATRDGLAAVLRGTQCMTVYEPTSQEALGAVIAAEALLRSEAPAATATINDGARDLPYVQTPVVSIFPANVSDVLADGFVTKAELCTDEMAQACKDGGID